MPHRTGRGGWFPRCSPGYRVARRLRRRWRFCHGRHGRHSRHGRPKRPKPMTFGSVGQSCYHFSIPVSGRAAIHLTAAFLACCHAEQRDQSPSMNKAFGPDRPGRLSLVGTRFAWRSGEANCGQGNLSLWRWGGCGRLQPVSWTARRRSPAAFWQRLRERGTRRRTRMNHAVSTSIPQPYIPLPAIRLPQNRRLQFPCPSFPELRKRPFVIRTGLPPST